MTWKNNPWIASVTNGLLPGLGYLYLGSKRSFFSLGLILSGLVLFLSPAWWRQGADTDTLYWVSVAVLAVVFATDAWKDAKERA